MVRADDPQKMKESDELENKQKLSVPQTGQCGGTGMTSN